VLIVAVTIFGAVVTWRAASAAGTAADFDQRARQAHVFGDQLKGEYESQVSYEARLFESFRSHVKTADALERDAEQLGRRDTSLRAALRREARVHRAVARALELPFAIAPVDGAYPGDPYSRALYDARAELRSRLDEDPQLQELKPQALEEAANGARDKRLSLVAVDTVVIASIFFLTLALLAARMRREFALAGVSLATAAVVAFVVVQIVVEVPSP
jgi:hypothetical protein